MSGLGWFIAGVLSTYAFWIATIALYVALFDRRNTTIDVRQPTDQEQSDDT